MKKTIFLILSLVSISLFSGCEKEWFEAKPDKTLVIPTTVSDYQLLLNNRSVFGVNTPSLTEVGAGDFFLPTNVWISTNTVEKNTYVWADDIYQGLANPDWISSWNQILNSNVVLEGLEALPATEVNKPQYNSVKGQALFYRAWCYYNLAMTFCKPYDAKTATTDQGLPYRTSPDVNERISRGSLQNFYDRIITDFNEAKQLLPTTQQYKTQPTKIAVSAVLARLYLSISNYEQASTNAAECLANNIPLLDYNNLDINLDFPMPLFNVEVVWHAEMGSYGTFPSSNGVVDTELFNSYEANDLRKVLFFGTRTNGISFNGMYTGVRTAIFCGIAMDEIYLIQAECLIRKGSIGIGIDILNALMDKRYTKKNGVSSFVNFSAVDETSALKLVFRERRKELLMRNLRWSDLRRLNKDDRFKVTLMRNLGAQTFSLQPNDPKYTLLIPTDEIRNGGMEQTIR